MTTETKLCHCGSSLSFTDCCEPIHQDIARATTAESLMRARYSAFATGNVDFLADSLTEPLRRDFDRVTAAAWARSEWLGLEVRSVQAGQAEDASGEVEFVARFRLQGVERQHHERARFVREGRGWRYDDGELIGETHAPVVAGPKIGRNETCPCGSGKKYKKCCGGRQQAA